MGSQHVPSHIRFRRYRCNDGLDGREQVRIQGTSEMGTTSSVYVALRLQMRYARVWLLYTSHANLPLLCPFCDLAFSCTECAVKINTPRKLFEN
nr:MAG TPA: zinc finger domain protein [Caudoviricetes sp.]